MDDRANPRQPLEVAGIRLVHVTSGIGREEDGASMAALRICDLMSQAGADVTLASINGEAHAVRSPLVTSFAAQPFLRTIGGSASLRHWLDSQARAGTILHSHGLWRMPGIYAGRLARRGLARLVVSPHGALSERALSKSRYRKRLFWGLLQRSALQAATCFHATSDAECEDIRRAGFRQPVCILRHGVDVPAPAQVDRSRRRLLFLGRVHALKGIETLIRAWQRVEGGFPSWDLEVVGPGHPEEVRGFAALAARLGIARLRFRGPLHGRDKTRAFQEADLFVLPSPSENFGLVIAESLAAGTPVIVTKGTPWKELEARGAGWWIEFGVESLERALRAAMSKEPSELQAMGQAGRAWMAKEFSWEDVGRQWQETYCWLARPDAVPRPSWIRTG